METITLPKKKLNIILSDVERLLSHFEDLVDQQDIKAKQRIEDIKTGKIEGKSEQELDDYLKKRGVKVA